MARVFAYFMEKKVQMTDEAIFSDTRDHPCYDRQSAQPEPGKDQHQRHGFLNRAQAIGVKQFIFCYFRYRFLIIQSHDSYRNRKQKKIVGNDNRYFRGLVPAFLWLKISNTITLPTLKAVAVAVEKLP